MFRRAMPTALMLIYFTNRNPNIHKTSIIFPKCFTFSNEITIYGLPYVPEYLTNDTKINQYSFLSLESKTH